MKRFFYLFLLLAVIAGCSTPIPKDEAIISGTVVTPGVQAVTFTYFHGISLTPSNRIEKAEVDSSGHFSITIPVKQLIATRITAGNYLHTMYLAPGDSMRVLIDTDTIEYSGRGAAKNNFMYAIEVSGLNTMGRFRLCYNPKLSPDSFMVAMDDFDKSQYELFSDYPEAFSSEFIQQYKTERRYNYLRSMLIYMRYFSYLKKKADLPAVFPDQMLAYKNLAQAQNDSLVNNDNYLDYIESLVGIRTRELMNADTALTDYGDCYMSVIKDSLRGKTQNYIAALAMNGRLKADTLVAPLYTLFQATNPDARAQDYVQAAIDKYHAKRAIIGQPLIKEFAETMVEDSAGHQIAFGDLMKRYKGKIVYLDIWSLNCGPCRSLMPFSHRLHEEIKDLPVEMVYINQDQASATEWQQVVKVSQGHENRFRMVDSQWGTAPMLKFLGVNYVPCYLLFDQDGRLLDYSAPRPYPLDKIETKLKTLASKI